MPRSGKGEALRRGAQMARGEFVVFIDADLDLPPEQILFFVAIQRVKKADAVIGSKMHPDSTVDYPLIRRVYSLGYFWLVKLLFGLPVRDTQTGLKLVRRDLLLRALEKTECRGFTLDLELLVRLVQLGAVMVEAPVVVRHSMKFGGDRPARRLADFPRHLARVAEGENSAARPELIPRQARDDGNS